MSQYRYRLICSSRPRPHTQSSHAKWGSGSWSRDTHHASLDTGKPLHYGAQTLCGRDARDWLIIDAKAEPMTAVEAAAYEQHDLCKRCAAMLSRIVERADA